MLVTVLLLAWACTASMRVLCGHMRRADLLFVTAIARHFDVPLRTAGGAWCCAI
jgi:hypothetical protein